MAYSACKGWVQFTFITQWNLITLDAISWVLLHVIMYYLSGHKGISLRKKIILYSGTIIQIPSFCLTGLSKSYNTAFRIFYCWLLSVIRMSQVYLEMDLVPSIWNTCCATPSCFSYAFCCHLLLRSKHSPRCIKWPYFNIPCCFYLYACPLVQGKKYLSICDLFSWLSKNYLNR